MTGTAWWLWWTPPTVCASSWPSRGTTSPRRWRRRFGRGSRDGMRFSLRDLTESWCDGFDPSDANAVKDREALLGVLRDCIARIEAAATLD
jgi:hypothetical protein